MSIKSFLTLALLAVGSVAIPQQTSSDSGSADSSTSVSPSQTSVFKAAVASYYQSLKHSPEFTELGIALALNGGSDDVLSQIEANPSQLLPITGTSIDLQSLATDPPLTFPSYSFYSGLGTDLIDSIKSIQTSAALAIASIDQSVLGTSTQIKVPTNTASSSSSSGGAGAAMAKPTGVMAMGAAVGALGAAVALL
ncbi:hypothetical protein NA57DRAFT_77650 [Rhizodiscina lignyota]|uniref:Uncharacterized protein n=1 Tax=Rhizodiscina lignyota TaxID=1504668 RepID=A0A9P4M4X3_9PEZI|nr:hypothetical protein NA57DRAFT_77650 [Rhizodiscina lignyota]